jgi:hypothetical protein
LEYNFVSGIINLGFDFLHLLIDLIKLFTLGRIGKLWGISLAMKQLQVKAEYPND